MRRSSPPAGRARPRSASPPSTRLCCFFRPRWRLRFVRFCGRAPPPRSRRVPESCKIDVLPHPGTPTVHGGSPTTRARRTAAPMADQNGAPDGTHRRSSRTRRPVESAPTVLKRGQKFQRALAECRELRVAWADEHTVGRNHKKRRREVYEKHGLDRYQWSQCYTKYRKHPHRRGHRAGHRVGG